MPLYLFETSDGEVIELFYSMNDAPRIGETVSLEDGKTAKRIPTLSFIKEGDGNIYDVNALASKTYKNETLGDTMDRSSELSARRASENGGVDPWKTKSLKEYSEKRGGMSHPSATKKQ